MPVISVPCKNARNKVYDRKLAEQTISPVFVCSYINRMHCGVIVAVGIAAVLYSKNMKTKNLSPGTLRGIRGTRI